MPSTSTWTRFGSVTHFEVPFEFQEGFFHLGKKKIGFDRDHIEFSDRFTVTVYYCR